ncbi:MAG: hypothetical protein FWC70_07280 [Defluviitaleaceae bacterium]|nr:hypothetical protein [Defluviitaleaceae bacterium]
MKNALALMYLGACAKVEGAKNFVVAEAGRIKNDERGMELLQVILIILFVIIIAAVVWALLGDVIRDLIDQIFNNMPTPTQGDLM